MKQITISSRDRQTPCYDNGTTDLLNRLNLSAPTRGTMVKVTGNSVPGAVGQGCGSLFPGLEVPRINGSGQVRQSFGSGAQGELAGSGCLSAVVGCLEHWIDSLWSSVFQS